MNNMINKNEIIMIDNKPIRTCIHQKNEYYKLEVDTIKTPYDFKLETMQRLGEEINEAMKKFEESIELETDVDIGKTYFSTPGFKKDVFEKIKDKLFKIIKNPKSYNNIE